MVMSMVLFVLGNLVFLGAIAGGVLQSLESKIDISMYFVSDAAEENIVMIKHDLEMMPAVREVAYVSRDMALDTFRERHKNNALIADALTELGENPLEASLNIRAQDSSRYGEISNFLVQKNYPGISKINYFENQKVIDRLASVITTVRGFGAALALVLAFVAISVAFNTVRLAIYTMREEIGIMRLVGATMWFIRGPFLISGLLYGVSAAILTVVVFFPLTWLASPKILLLIPQFDLFHYFLVNFWQFFSIMAVAGILLGTISSMIAIRRYLEA